MTNRTPAQRPRRWCSSSSPRRRSSCRPRCATGSATSSSVTDGRWSTGSGRRSRTERSWRRSTPGASRCTERSRRRDPKSPTEQSAFDEWLEQTADRESATNDRLHGAEGVIPPQLWLVLLLIAGIVVGYVLFFADSGEHRVVQAMLIGSVVAVVTLDAAADPLARQPLQERQRRAGTGRDGARAAPHGPQARDRRQRGTAASLRRARVRALMTGEANDSPGQAPPRGRLDGAAGAGDRGHGVGRVPVLALARRAGSGPGARERGPSRRRRACRASPTARGRSTLRSSSSGWTRARRATASSRGSIASASPSGSSRRSPHGSRRRRSAGSTPAERRSTCPSTASPSSSRPSAWR